MKIAATILYGIAALVYLTGGILLSKNKTDNKDIILEIISFVAGIIFTILLIASIIVG